MAVKVDLPKELVLDALDQAASLRRRNANATKNSIIRDALQQEVMAIAHAMNTLAEIVGK